MATEKNMKIIVIDDNMSQKSPLLVEIKLELGIEPILFSKSQEGLEYVLGNLNQAMIVIIDIMFPSKEIQGIDVLKSIRDKTSLVSIIMMSSNTPTDIGTAKLLEIINNKAFAFMDRALNLNEKILIIKDAIHNLSSSVDAVLERWILRQPNDKMNKPYLLSPNGTSYSLNQILHEVRMRTELGKTLERNIIQIAVDLLVKDQKQD